MMKGLFLDFGFCSYKGFLLSLLRPNESILIAMLSTIATYLEVIFGLQVYSLLALALILIVELSTGIAASFKKKTKFSAKKINRFGLKFGVYFFILFVFAAFKKNTFGIEHYIYYTLHSFITFYIILVYLISVLENVLTLLGGRSSDISRLLNILKMRLRSEEEKLVGKSDDIILEDKSSEGEKC